MNELNDELIRRAKRLPRFYQLNFEPPRWLDQVWTPAILALAGEPIEYLDGEWEDDEGKISFTLIIFTKGRLIIETASGPSRFSINEPVTITVRARSRRPLLTLDIEGGHPYPIKDMSDWPGRVSCTAAYEHESWTFPLPGADDTQYRDLVAFLPSLLADLDPPSQ
jgi:hypothetical protein